jgi:HEAT repeats
VIAAVARFLALGELAAVILLACVLVGRRTVVRAVETRRERLLARYDADVLDLVCGDGGEEPAVLATVVGAAEREAVGELMTRYAGTVKAASRARLTAFVEEHGYVDGSVRELRRHAEWRRGRAAKTLGDLASSRATPELRRVALEDGSGRVRTAAVRALGRVGGEDGAEAVLEAWVTARVPAGIAAQSLLDVGAAAAGPLLAAAGDARPRVREMACRALGHAGADGSPEVVRELALRAVDDVDAGVREAACSALATAGSDDAAFALASAMSDESADVRRAACEAAARLRISDLQAVAAALTHDADARVARAAASAVEAVRPLHALALPFGREAVADRTWGAR